MDQYRHRWYWEKQKNGRTGFYIREFLKKTFSSLHSDTRNYNELVRSLENSHNAAYLAAEDLFDVMPEDCNLLDEALLFD